MEELLELDMIDTYRKFHPSDREGFTFFTNYPGQGHMVKHGSRIDYFIVSKELQENVINSVIRSGVVDFTHSPITMFMMLK
jgi:exodeoxyribonuclease III